MPNYEKLHSCKISKEEAKKRFLNGENVFILNIKTSQERLVLNENELELQKCEIYID